MLLSFCYFIADCFCDFWVYVCCQGFVCYLVIGLLDYCFDTLLLMCLIVNRSFLFLYVFLNYYYRLSLFEFVMNVSCCWFWFNWLRGCLCFVNSNLIRLRYCLRV